MSTPYYPNHQPTEHCASNGTTKRFEASVVCHMWLSMSSRVETVPVAQVPSCSNCTADYSIDFERKNFTQFAKHQHLLACQKSLHYSLPWHTWASTKEAGISQSSICADICLIPVQTPRDHISSSSCNWYSTLTMSMPCSKPLVQWTHWTDYADLRGALLHIQAFVPSHCGQHECGLFVRSAAEASNSWAHFWGHLQHTHHTFW